jgi:hypothetical protein
MTSFSFFYNNSDQFLVKLVSTGGGMPPAMFHFYETMFQETGKSAGRAQQRIEQMKIGILAYQ